MLSSFVEGKTGEGGGVEGWNEKLREWKDINWKAFKDARR